jgi:hypothetical protein
MRIHSLTVESHNFMFKFGARNNQKHQLPPIETLRIGNNMEGVLNEYVL